MDKLDVVLAKQLEFQRLLDIPVDSVVESDILQMAEKHCFGAVEELMELRKTFPSTLNKHEKNRPEINRQRIKEEYCDVLLYVMNHGQVWKFTKDEILEQLHVTQDNNFLKAKTRLMKQLNHEILRSPGICGIGSGNLSPAFIFIGQNPGENITHGYEVWSDPESGSSKILLPLLDELEIRDKCYFTNVVKSTTSNNRTPNKEEFDYWYPYLQREIKILSAGNIARLVPMGSWAQSSLKLPGIAHPASVLRGFQKKDAYRASVINFLNGGSIDAEETASPND